MRLLSFDLWPDYILEKRISHWCGITETKIKIVNSDLNWFINRSSTGKKLYFE